MTHSLGSSDDGTREGLSDSDEEQSALATPAEKYFHGLLKGKAYSRANVIVGYQDGRGRSAFAKQNFAAGDFVCEYASCPKLKSEAERLDDDGRYQSLGLGSYSLDAFIDGNWWTFDATGTINDPGRYINHASRNTNLVLMKPVRIGERYRIGFVARYSIQKGDELFYHYGIRDPDIPWLISDARKMASQTAQITVNNVTATDTTNHSNSTYTNTTNTTAPTNADVTTATKKPSNRTRLRCPFTDCASHHRTPSGLSKLSQHLLQVHAITNKAEREQLCQRAKQVCGLNTL